jgi:hypothetical protein
MYQNAPTDDEVYVITDPRFATVDECLTFVGFNQPTITTLMTQHFPTQGIRNVYCVTQEVLDKIDNTPPSGGTEAKLVL